MDPTKKPAAEPPGEADDSAQDDLDTRIARALDTRLNAAITGHMKRAQGAWEKALDDKLAKLAPAAPPPAQPADKPVQGADKADPETLTPPREARGPGEEARRGRGQGPRRRGARPQGRHPHEPPRGPRSEGHHRAPVPAPSSPTSSSRAHLRGPGPTPSTSQETLRTMLKTADAAECLPAAAPGARSRRVGGGGVGLARVEAHAGPRAALGVAGDAPFGAAAAVARVLRAGRRT